MTVDTQASYIAAGSKQTPSCMKASLLPPRGLKMHCIIFVNCTRDKQDNLEHAMKRFHSPRRSYCRATFQILLDLGRVFAVESFQLLVELHVPLVDVVDVGVFVDCPTTTVLGSLRYPVYSTRTTKNSHLFRPIN